MAACIATRRPPSARKAFAWTVDLNASADELHKQALALQGAEASTVSTRPERHGLVTPLSHARSRKPKQNAETHYSKSGASSELLQSVSRHPHILAEVLHAANVGCLAKLATLSKSSQKIFNSEEVWRAACLGLALNAQLYVPTSYALGWKRLFWDHLWPSRHKWSSNATRCADFQIRVGVRFRPSGSRHSGSADHHLFLPLHQRLRLWRAGKISQAEIMQVGVDATLVDALRAHGELPPEMVEAILVAQHLKAQAVEAQMQVASGARSAGRSANDAGLAAPESVAQLDVVAGDIATAPGVRENTSGNMDAGTTVSLEPSEQDATVDTQIHAMEGRDAPRERRGGNPRVLAVQPSRVMMYVPGQGTRDFAFGRVLDESQSQEAVYAELGHDMICSMLNGFNACLFCYGQTGSGKTHTLFGPEGSLEEQLDKNHLSCNVGILLRALHEVLDQAKNLQMSQGVTIATTCQYVEIYNEQVCDLLAGGEVQIRGPQANLQGAAEVPVTSFAEAVQVLRNGQVRKHIAQTAMNERSSRAHTVFALNLTQVNERSGEIARSTLHLVDLAGCEQLKTSKATGARQIETIGINSSLFVLGKVITALVEGRSHVPYLESALTRLLRPALGGNSRTAVVVTCSPDEAHGDQTLHALRFGERCQQVVNRAELEEVRSIDDALRTIDAALSSTRRALCSQEQRGLQHLPAHQRLREKYVQLQQTRCSLVSGMKG